MAVSEETRAKIRKAWEKRRLTFVPPMKGKKMSEESRRKMSAAAKARGSNRTGKRHTPEAREKIRKATQERTARGERHYAYSHGKHQRDKSDRRRAEYGHWRDAVFQRDRYTCQECGDARGGNLQAHHRKPFADHLELRFDIDNGVTLCQDCHERLHLKPIPMFKCRRKKHPHPTPAAPVPA